MNTLKDNECKIYFNETRKVWVTQKGAGFYAEDVDGNHTAAAAIREAEKMGLTITNKKQMEYCAKNGF